MNCSRYLAIIAEMQKLILRNFQSPGDIVMLTAAVRDLHRCYPGRFLTDVRTSCPDLWTINPYLTPLDEHDPKARCSLCKWAKPVTTMRNRRYLIGVFKQSIYVEFWPKA